MGSDQPPYHLVTALKKRSTNLHSSYRNMFTIIAGRKTYIGSVRVPPGQSGPSPRYERVSPGYQSDGSENRMRREVISQTDLRIG